MDVPHQQLASAMGFREKKAQDLQETLQRVLDRREEERQSKELLQLYLKAVAKEREQDETNQAGNGVLSMLRGFFSPNFNIAHDR